MDDGLTVVVDGDNLTIDDVYKVAYLGAEVSLPDSKEFWNKVDSTYGLNKELVERGVPIYGVSTGFGDSVNRHVGVDRTTKLQENLIKYQGCGMGPLLPREQARAVVLARLNCLAKGNSAVRRVILHQLVELLNRDIIPCIPEQGSVGASGDLVPSSYIAAVLTGRRKVYYEGEIRETAEVFLKEGLEPVTLESKEGLALINGTAFMTGLACLSIFEARKVAEVADVCTALITEVLTGISGAFAPFIHKVKPHLGQQKSARHIDSLLQTSQLARSYEDAVASLGTLDQGFRILDLRIQDKYSIRCAPQIIGVLYDVIDWTTQLLETEINSSNDNPLYNVEDGRVYSGGNFTGGHVGIAMDTLKVALASVGDLLDRQFELVIDEKFNMGLPPNMAQPLPLDHPEAGIHHGFKGVQLLISSLAAEALNQTMPMTSFSRSTACHNQDKVSMAATAARITRNVVDIMFRLEAAHLLILCQAADFRGKDQLGGTRSVYDKVREVSSFVEWDRELDADLAAVEQLLRSGEIASVMAFPEG